MFSFIGIMLGVAVLIVVMSVMNGFREDFIDRILGINSHISIFSNDRELKNYNNLVKLIKDNNNVDYVNPIIEEQVIITNHNFTTGAIVKGITKNDLKNKDKIYQNLISNNFDNSYIDNAIIIGQSLASKLLAQEGDEITIISPENNSTILGNIPRMKSYKIVGIFTSGMYEYDIGVVFIPLNMAQTHFKYSNSCSGIEIYLKNPSILDNTYNELKDVLKKNKYKVNIVDWKKSNSAFVEAINIERNVMFLILTLIIVIATFNIISSLTMLVNDKIKQIALLRTIGFTKSNITKIFIISGSMIGFSGTILGTIIGILFATNIQNIKNWIETHFSVELFSPTVYFLTELPSRIIWSDVVFIVMLSLILSLLSTIYPAYKASKTNPAEILRYE